MLAGCCTRCGSQRSSKSASAVGTTLLSFRELQEAAPSPSSPSATAGRGDFFSFYGLQEATRASSPRRQEAAVHGDELVGDPAVIWCLPSAMRAGVGGNLLQGGSVSGIILD
uniref:Uncharacterized protein n=1 Tax=Arundo donax TaxID=35708 RepID=A0A0A9DSF4_ARUDO